MEIIKVGVIPQEKSFDATCINCKSEVRFKRSEAKERFDRNETVLVVVCPVCANEIWKLGR